MYCENIFQVRFGELSDYLRGFYPHKVNALALGLDPFWTSDMQSNLFLSLVDH